LSLEAIGGSGWSMRRIGRRPSSTRSGMPTRRDHPVPRPSA